MSNRAQSVRQNLFGMIAQRDWHDPIISKELEIALNISGPTVRDLIRELRRSGEPIVASEYGYYMASSAEEVSLIVKDLQSRINSMATTISELKRKAYERFGDQARFEFCTTRSVVQKNTAQSTNGICAHSEKKGQKGKMLPVQMDHQKKSQERIFRGSADFALDSLL